MITSVANPHIKNARKLQRRRHRHATGRLLIEGVRLVQDAAASGIRPHQVFYAPELFTDRAPEARPALLEELAATGADIYPCSAAVLAALTETVTPQGIAAVVPLPRLPWPAAPRLVLILDRVREPGNAGSLLRSAEAAGADAALFAPDTVDPYNDKALRAGMGAHFRVPLRVCPTWPDLLAHAARSTARPQPHPPGEDAPDPALALYMADAHAALAYDEVDWTQPAALIIGGEAEGASPAAAQLAMPIAIPMLGRAESLNAAAAGAVILFEAARQRRHAKR